MPRPVPSKPARRVRRDARPEVRDAARRKLLSDQVESLKTAGRARVAVCHGPALVAWYPADAPVSEILADLTRWAADPAWFESRPWPICVNPAWEWSPGEVLALWSAGRVVALVAKTAAGATEAARIDPDWDARPPA